MQVERQCPGGQREGRGKREGGAPEQRCREGQREETSSIASHSGGNDLPNRTPARRIRPRYRENADQSVPTSSSSASEAISERTCAARPLMLGDKHRGRSRQQENRKTASRKTPASLSLRLNFPPLPNTDADLGIASRHG